MAIAIPADADQAQAARLRRRDRFGRTIMIGGNHRRAARHHQIAEQPQLGGQIVRDVGVIIHVVARQIGKSAGADPQPVEPVLIKAVRGCFQREMADALAGDFIDGTMQRDRIGRGQRAIDGALRRHQTDGADAGRCQPLPLPDLPRERRNRGLAGSAGDRGNGGRLARIKPGRGQRQRAARIGDAQQRHPGFIGRQMIASHRDRPRFDRLGDKLRPVGFDTGQREKQIARPHSAAIDRQPADFQRGGRRRHHDIFAEQLRELHDICLVGSS